MSKNEEKINITKDTESGIISYSKRWEDDGLTYRLEVEEVEGGYIITKNVYGRKKSGGDDAEYIDKTTKKVTTENPLAKKEESEQEKSSPLLQSIKTKFNDIQIM